MLIADLTIALLTSVVLSTIFGLGFSRLGWSRSLLMFFMIVFLMSWAGGLWLDPIGPQIFGRPWVSPVVIGLVMSLLITALIPTPKPRPQSQEEAQKQLESEVGFELALSAFFWILVLILLFAIGYAYLSAPGAAV